MGITGEIDLHFSSQHDAYYLDACGLMFVWDLLSNDNIIVS